MKIYPSCKGLNPYIKPPISAAISISKFIYPFGSFDLIGEELNSRVSNNYVSSELIVTVARISVYLLLGTITYYHPMIGLSFLLITLLVKLLEEEYTIASFEKLTDPQNMNKLLAQAQALYTQEKYDQIDLGEINSILTKMHTFIHEHHLPDNVQSEMDKLMQKASEIERFIQEKKSSISNHT